MPVTTSLILTLSMHGIYARLLRAEDDLLLALSSGSLECFENEWSQLSHEITLATKENRLPDTIQALASTVSTRIYAIASFVDLDTQCRELTTSFLEEVDSIISKETQPSCCLSLAPTKSAIPPYIPPAYAWLLDNLHCPYPSTSMRDSLAKKSGSPRKAIDAWFIDVRKRIGWNALRRTRFCGKKDEIIRAATLFFCENKGNDKLGLEFASIEAAARDLYVEKLRPSALVSHLIEAVERRPSKKDDLTPTIARQYMAFPSPSPPPAPSSSCQTTPSAKWTRSFDDIEPETHSCQRPSKRQRVTSRSPSPVFSHGISKPRSSSPDQLSSFSERHPLRPHTSQWPIPGSNSNSLHEVSKQARKVQDASTVLECSYASSSREPRSSMIHSGNSNLEVQLSLRDGSSSVSDVSQVNHRRCMSEVGFQLQSSLKNESSHLQSASDPAFSGTCGLIGWPFDPLVVPSNSAFGSLDSTAECEVATFDSTWSPESLDQADLTIPFQLPSSCVQMGFRQPSIPSNAFIATPSDDNLGSLNSAPFGDELLEIFDFPHEAPSKSGLATFPTTLPSHETGSFNTGFGFKFDNGMSHAAESFSWDVAVNVKDILGPLLQQSAPVSDYGSTMQLSENDKSKKLKLLAEVQEFAHRLEAEIAVM